jgi:2,5-diketo-D-gluconate reductase A
MEENFGSVDVKLDDVEVQSITALEREGRVGGHPDEVE